MSNARDVIADYLAKCVFVNEECDEPGCELPDEAGPCQRTCSMYRIDCLGHANDLVSALNSAGIKSLTRDEVFKIIANAFENGVRSGRSDLTLNHNDYAHHAVASLFDAAPPKEK